MDSWEDLPEFKRKTFAAVVKADSADQIHTDTTPVMMGTIRIKKRESGVGQSDKQPAHSSPPPKPFVNSIEEYNKIKAEIFKD